MILAAQLGQEGSYLSQYMRSRRGGRGDCALQERLLTDRDAYMAHLEDQVQKVTAACMLADELKAGHDNLLKQVECLAEKLDTTNKLMLDAEARHSEWRNAQERAARALEGVPERVEVLGVEVEKAKRAQVVLARLGDAEERMGRMEERHESELRMQEERLSRLTMQLQTASAGNDRLEERLKELEGRHKEAVTEIHREMGAQTVATDEQLTHLREVVLPKSLSELRLAQERMAIDGSKDITRVRHEVGMAENRMLAALAKQAALAQEQLSQLQDLMQEAVAHPLTAVAASGINLTNRAPAPFGGLQRDEAVTQDADEISSLTRRVQVLSAALRSSDEKKRKSMEKLQGTMAALGQRCVDAAKEQTRTTLEVVGKFEERIEAVEASVDSTLEGVKELKEQLRGVEERVVAAGVGGGGGEGGARTRDREQTHGTKHGPVLEGSPDFRKLLERSTSMQLALKKSVKEVESLKKRVDGLELRHATSHRPPTPPSVAAKRPSSCSHSPQPSASEPSLPLPPSPRRSSSVASIPDTITEPPEVEAVAGVKRQPVASMPQVEPRLTREGALQALRVIEELADDPRPVGSPLKGVIKEVAELFMAISSSDQPTPRAPPPSTTAATTTSAPSGASVCASTTTGRVKKVRAAATGATPTHSRTPSATSLRVRKQQQQPHGEHLGKGDDRDASHKAVRSGGGVSRQASDVSKKSDASKKR